MVNGRLSEPLRCRLEGGRPDAESLSNPASCCRLSTARMSLLREFMWLWVIAGMVFVSVLISLLFVLISRCISRGGFFLQHLERARCSVTEGQLRDVSVESDRS